VDTSANVPHRMTPAQVEAAVLDEIARDVEEVGRALVPAKVLSITLVRPGDSYETSTGASFELDGVMWAVVFEGTALACTSFCTQFTGGTYLIDDVAGGVTGSALTGEVP
jgi:hypothetical protein